MARGVSNAGFGTLGGGTAAADSDGDGMPNAWETKHGTNPAVANNNGDFDFDGYTDLEEYLNDLAAFTGDGAARVFRHWAVCGLEAVDKSLGAVAGG